jgi:hypothetical protein
MTALAWFFMVTSCSIESGLVLEKTEGWKFILLLVRLTPPPSLSGVFCA